MSQKIRFSLGGTLLLLALFFIILGALLGAGLSTSTYDPIAGLFFIIIFYLIPGLLIGFIGLYLFFGASEQ